MMDKEIARLKKLLEYDPKTGLFMYLVRGKGRTRGWFPGTLVQCSMWKENIQGVMVEHKNFKGYQITIANVTYKAHHLAWMLSYGVWARPQHIDKNVTNNCLANLTLAVLDTTKSSVTDTAKTKDFLNFKPHNSRSDIVQAILAQFTYDPLIGVIYKANGIAAASYSHSNKKPVVRYYCKGKKTTCSSINVAYVLHTGKYPAKILKNLDGDLANIKWDNVG